MGRRSKKSFKYDEYVSPRKKAVQPDQHTEYGRNTSRTILIAPLQAVVQVSGPPAAESPTPTLDWVLESPNEPYRFYDGDMEISEMEDCELEALGLSKYITRKKNQTEQASKRRKTQSTHPIHFWTPHIDLYVDEILRLEGCFSQPQDTCSSATCTSESGGTFRCRDCKTLLHFCAECIVANHQHLPFHHIERWTDNFFERVLLKDLGLRVQLGHPDGTCGLPINAFNNDFVVIAPNGIHQIALDYCGCPQAQTKPVQLLRSRLFPSTVTDPKTAATFAVLKQFQLLTFGSKVSGYEFYKTLTRMSDNTGTRTIPDRYAVFLRIVREWRHVWLLKRMGRGHSDTGVKGTKEGECAVLCPACPQPGMNLPSNWKEQPESQQWLYSLFIGIDANFRLKRLNVSSDEHDPCLNHGYAYMVETKKFQSYLAIYDNKFADEKSSCNNHDAIKSASARGGHGTAASGLGTAECSRHDMKRPIAVGDLQKGERYVNMDYFFLSSIQFCTLLRFVVSYDIACEWAKNLPKRCMVYPANILSTVHNLVMVYLVPKFHLAAHIPKCQTAFSFNYTPGVGRTDGEAPERGWAAANGIASSTKEMGPGSRNDTIDDHFGDYNWRKIASIAETFCRKAKEALEGRSEHVEAFVEFDAALPPEETKVWTTMCQAWEHDSSQVNPFVIPKNAIVTDADVRLRLAREDAEALARGDAITIHEDISPSMLISQGIQLQEQQARLAYDIAQLGLHSTSLQQTKILERTNSLKRRIDAWISVQHLYMPAVALLRSRNDANASTPIAVQDIRLFLPSAIADTVSCPQNLLRCEWEFRYSQADETLNALRGFLLLRSHMYRSKDRHSRGQKQSTRSCTLLARVQAKITETAKTYHLTYDALISLSSHLHEFSWRGIFQPLLDAHIVGLSSMDDSRSEGRKQLSWIWKVQGTGDGVDARTQAALCVEWCKARARAHRWQEECVLLAEEMRRVVAFFKTQADQWRSRAESVRLLASDAALREGKIAYAFRQATIRVRVSIYFI